MYGHRRASLVVRALAAHTDAMLRCLGSGTQRPREILPGNRHLGATLTARKARLGCLVARVILLPVIRAPCRAAGPASNT